jgi:long-chain acyl-CoA synthetase
MSVSGMTETSAGIFITAATDSAKKKLETVGKALPHVRAKIIDSQNRILPRGCRGELCISGFLLQKGYYKNEEKTAEAMIRDEKGVIWMHTGDEALIDEEGYCRITGRIKDIIIRGKFAPSCLESIRIT